MKSNVFSRAVSLFLLATTAAAAPPETPQNVTATIQSETGNIILNWSPVMGATGYTIRVYDSLTAAESYATISVAAEPAAYGTRQPCGFSAYYTVSATNGDGSSAPSARVLGQSPDCPYAVPNCDFPAVAIPGPGTYVGTTVGHRNDYRIGDKVGPCDDGLDPGTAGTAPDVVYRYRSLTDCVLTVSLLPDDLEFNPILYAADSCIERECLVYSNTFLAQPEVISFPVSAGQDYFIFVDGYTDDDSGSYQITFNSGNCQESLACTGEVTQFSEGGLPEGWTTFESASPSGVPEARYTPAAWGVIEDLTGPLYNRVAAAFADPLVNANTEEWLISSPITIGEDAVLRWRDAWLGEPLGTLLLNVYVGTGPTPAELLAGGPVLTLGTSTLNSAFTPREVALAPLGYVNETIYVGFFHFARKTGYVLVDDVAVCSTPATTEGEGEGVACEPPNFHSADTNQSNSIQLQELLRVIQFFNSPRFGCGAGPDGFVAGGDAESCCPHSSDYSPQNFRISLPELLRLIQFFNSGGYYPCFGQGTPDGYCAGPPPSPGK